MWKKRFLILLSMPTFKLAKQVQIVVATAALHNYILMHDDNDVYRAAALGEGEDCQGGLTTEADMADAECSENVSGNLWMHAVRDAIAGDMIAARAVR